MSKAEKAAISKRMTAYWATRRKNEAAVALGRLGGLQRAKTGIDKINPRRRSQIASIAARVRWASNHPRKVRTGSHHPVQAHPAVRIRTVITVRSWDQLVSLLERLTPGTDETIEMCLTE